MNFFLTKLQILFPRFFFSVMFVSFAGKQFAVNKDLLPIH